MIPPALPRQLTTTFKKPKKVRVCSEEFKELHAKIVQQLKTKKGVINPRSSKWVPYWDGLLMLLLIYTALVTPIEVCLFPDTRLSVPGMTTLFVCNRIVDAIFVTDLVLNFFMCYQETTQRGGHWVINKKKIRSHYLRGWFTIDLLSVIPFELMMQVGLIQTGQTSMLRLTRTVRLLRLVKLLRILRASRLVARWQSFFGISYAVFKMIQFFLMTFFVVHLMACAWAWLGINWVGSTGYTLAWEQTWITKYEFADTTTVRLYVISLYVAVVAMFGGVGPLSPSNYAEYVLYTGMMLFGSMIWAWVIGSLCGILATLNPHATAYQNTMDELEYFMRERNIAQDHRVRLRDFFRQTQDFSRLSSYNSLMVKMSMQLRGDTALRIGRSTLHRVWYFHTEHVEKEFLAAVALNLRGTIYDMREMLPIINLTAVTKGMAAKRMQIFSRGAVLGTDCVIPDEHQSLRDLEPASCLTFVQVSQISRASLFAVVEHFPVAKAHLRKASLLYMLRAGFRQYIKAHKEEEAAAKSFNKSNGGSFARGSTFKTRVALDRRRNSQLDFQQILHSVEAAAAKVQSDQRAEKNQNSFNKGVGPQHLLRMRRRSATGGGIPGYHAGFGLQPDGDPGDEPAPGWLGDEMSALHQAQKAHANQINELISKNEGVELQCSLLNDKLELILSLMSRGPASQDVGEKSCGAKSFGGSPMKCTASLSAATQPHGSASRAAGSASVGMIVDGQEIRKRRKNKPTMASLANAARASRRFSNSNLLGALGSNGGPSAPINGAASPGYGIPIAGTPGDTGSLVNLLSAVGAANASRGDARAPCGERGTTAARQQVLRQQQMARERAELREALDA